MAVVTMKQLLEAGVHFGHHTRRWNPKMKEYIFGERNGVYIIDLQKTADKIEEAYAALVDVVRNNNKVLFVGTRKQIQDVIKEGQIVEMGTDAELCALDGEYKRLRDIQFKTDAKQKSKKK